MTVPSWVDTASTKAPSKPRRRLLTSQLSKYPLRVCGDGSSTDQADVEALQSTPRKRG